MIEISNLTLNQEIIDCLSSSNILNTNNQDLSRELNLKGTIKDKIIINHKDILLLILNLDKHYIHLNSFQITIINHRNLTNLMEVTNRLNLSNKDIEENMIPEQLEVTKKKNLDMNLIDEARLIFNQNQLIHLEINITKNQDINDYE